MPIRIRARCAALLVAVMQCLPVCAGTQTLEPGYAELEVSGFAGIESRFFFESPQFAGQGRAAVSPSLILAPIATVGSASGQDHVTAAPFFRIDKDDDERTHVDLRQFDWVHRDEDWDLRLGVSQITWAVVESRHLVDVINQVDLVEDLDEEDKLGQPMANLNIDTGSGFVGFYYLPFFRQRTFPATDARLSGGLPIDEEARFEPGLGQWHPAVAVRYANTFDRADIGIAHYFGIGREPRLVPTLRPGGVVLQPRYDLINQSSLDLQYTVDALLLKAEAIHRIGQGEPFFATVAGFEYTLFGVFDSQVDVGLLAEYLYDGRDQAPAAPTTAFEDDVFLGTRLTFNDVDDTTLIAGAIIDRDTRATLLSIEAERRIGEGFKVEVEGRWFAFVPDQDPFAPIRDDDYIQIRLSYYF